VAIGVLSSMASNTGYLVLIPLGAAAFLSLGRHPIAGLAATFATGSLVAGRQADSNGACGTSRAPLGLLIRDAQPSTVRGRLRPCATASSSPDANRQ
jgi:hypothetical protein